MFSVFNAVLTSRLTLRELQMPVGSLRELAESDYKVLVRNGSYAASMLRSIKSNLSDYGRLYHSGRIVFYNHELNFTHVNKETVELITENQAWVAEKSAYLNFDEYPCKIIDLPCKGWIGNSAAAADLIIIKSLIFLSTVTILPTGNGLIWKKDFPYAELMNHHLSIISDAGLIDLYRYSIPWA